MTIIITGVAGFIGSNLAGNLLKTGEKVIGIDNFSTGFKRNITPFLADKHFTFLEKDLRRKETLKNISGDVIVHLASRKIPRYTNALATLEDNHTNSELIINKCIQDKIKLVFASTSDVYGKNPMIPYNEESDLLLGPTTVKRWSYALSKISSEHLIIANSDEHNLAFTICRFFGSYGPNQNLTWWGGPQSVFIEKSIKKEPLEIHGDGKQTRTFTYVDDTVQGIIKCIFEKESKNEIFNIAAEPEEEITILDLAKMIWGKVNGSHSEPLLELIPYETFGKYEDVMRRVPNIDKIKSMLGFQPKYSLDKGLKLTIEWQKQQSNSK